MNLRKGMSMDDLISIVLPIYNGEKYMKQRPVTQTMVSILSLVFSSLTRGHILMASGLVPKTSMILFI